MKKKIKIQLDENVRKSKVLETDERGVTQELHNMVAIRTEVDARKPEGLIVTCEFYMASVELETDKYKVVALNKQGEVKQVAKVIFADGTVDSYE